MADKNKITIDEKAFRKEQNRRRKLEDKDYRKKLSILTISLWTFLSLLSIAIMVVVICFTHDKQYFGFGLWAGAFALYTVLKSRKIISKQIGEIRKLNSPFTI